MHHATTAKLFQQKRAQRQGGARVKAAQEELRALRLQNHMALHETSTMPPARLCIEAGCHHAPKTYGIAYDPEAVRVTMNGVDVTKALFPEK